MQFYTYLIRFHPGVFHADAPRLFYGSRMQQNEVAQFLSFWQPIRELFVFEDIFFLKKLIG